MRRIFRERFLDVDDMKQRFASKPNRAELYTLFVNGEDWDTYSSLEDVKEVADDIYGNFGKSVKVVDGNGKVVYRPRFNTESRRPRGRMLKEESEDYYTYTIPEWTLPYIFNDDPSGLEDDEIEAVDNFVASLPKGWVIDVDEDEDGNTQTFFSHTNDLPGKHGKLGNTCVDVKVTVF